MLKNVVLWEKKAGHYRNQISVINIMQHMFKTVSEDILFILASKSLSNMFSNSKALLKMYTGILKVWLFPLNCWTPRLSA